jgi:hypothetical protein
MGQIRNAHKILVGKPKGKMSLGRSRNREDENIEMNLKEREVEWIYLAQERTQWRTVVNTVMNFGSHKRRGVFELVERLLVSQEGIYSLELVELKCPQMICSLRMSGQTESHSGLHKTKADDPLHGPVPLCRKGAGAGAGAGAASARRPEGYKALPQTSIP